MKDKMEICGSCGSIAPFGNYQCTRCHIPLEDVRIEAPAPEDDLVCARIAGGFVCRSCGSNIPLNYFTLNGYQCASCGSEQRFDWPLWGDIVKTAHNVTDICGYDQPDPAEQDFWHTFRELEGEEMVLHFRAIGRNSSFYQIQNTNPNLAPYSVSISPGTPVCADCRIPLTMAVEEGVFQVRCSQCGDANAYELISGLNEYLFLFSCISRWHRVDKQTEESRPTLPFPEESQTAWWMVFQGASTLRRKIERTMRRQNEARLKLERENQSAQHNAVEHHRKAQRTPPYRTALIVLGATLFAAAVAGAVFHFL